MAFDKNKVSYLNACSRHGYDVHDGTKNECCDECVTMPMLDREGFNSMTEKGQNAFIEDVGRIRKLPNLKEAGEPVLAWVAQSEGILKELQGEVAQALSENAEESEEEEESNDISAELNEAHAQGHMTGFVEGYKAGISDGFKMGVEEAKKLLGKK